jgi:hypothetical protein
LDVRAPTPGSESAFGVGALGADGAAGGLDSVRYEAAGNSRFAFRGGLLAAAIAAALGVIALLTGVSGGDIAAAVYRVDLFRRVGFTLWDNGWYAGHWTLSYSVLFGPIGAALGIPLTDVACAAIAAWAFDRLIAPRFDRVGHVAAAVFAIGTLVQIASGRVPFLLGEAIAILALLAAARRSWPLALLLAAVAAMCSPLAGGFIALVALAWLLADLPRRNLGSAALLAVASIAVGVPELLFPGQGVMPFSTLDFVAMVTPVCALGLLVEESQRTMRIGAGVYGLAVLACYLVPSAIGVNITRLATSVGLSLMLCALPALTVQGRWSLKVGRRVWGARTLFAVAVVSLALSEWVPAAGALLGSTNPSSSKAYFRPLLGYLIPHDRPLGRIEVVPTATHWEAVYVAPSLPLARGWERQLDTADNPIFYEPGKLNATSYRAWLDNNGVRFVALANAPLDYVAGPEARLLGAGVPGLKLVWRNANWRVYRVLGAAGIVSGAGRIVSEQGSTVVVDASRRGSLLVRIHYSPKWGVRSGHAALHEGPGGWLTVSARRTGLIVLAISL